MTDRDDAPNAAVPTDDAPTDELEDVPELTRFERALLDHPLARDAALVGFLVGAYGGFIR